MATHTAVIRWTRQGARFTDNHYSREHQWEFDGGAQVPASASPHVVPVPLSNPAHVDPEEAFIAALSSCHMLWFLSIAAKRGFVVEAYEDRAEGVMEPECGGPDRHHTGNAPSDHPLCRRLDPRCRPDRGDAPPGA